MALALSIGLFLPLLGFLILASSSFFIGRRLAGLIGCMTIFVSFLCFAWLLYTYLQDNMSPQVFTFYRWIPVEGINADFALRIDPLSLLMTLIITGVGFLIHVYSNGYMDHDADYARFFACLNFFVFAMLLLVLASHLLLLFVGWEGVGLASYLLIGFWYTRPSAAQAATKAFVVNRVGDCALLIGLLITFHQFGTSDVAIVSQRASEMFALGAPLLSIMTLLYFIGATGKSAQIPLQTWLPDAMEGPTPVSALIHAATMVTAGVYLVVRMHPVFMMTPNILHIVGAIGGATALYAALCALGQTDLKRVLAYSTVSQLGYMFLACGAGAFFAAMFHLTTHAFVKALLFLSAGNVVHMMHGNTEMASMGGLKRIFTKTHWLFLVGVLAMSGVPPLAAFFSKDLILEQEHLTGFNTLFIIGLLTSLLTGFYLMRAYCLTFLGPLQKVPADVKEPSNIMLIPVAMLALLSVVGGFLGFCVTCTTPVLESFLGQVGVTLAQAEDLGIAFLFTPETLISVVIAVLGVGSAYVIYTRYADQLGQTLQILKKSFYVDEIYDNVFVKPLRALSLAINHVVEPQVFDGTVRALAGVTQWTSYGLQKLQSGQIRSYVALDDFWNSIFDFIYGVVNEVN